MARVGVYVFRGMKGSRGFKRVRNEGGADCKVGRKGDCDGEPGGDGFEGLSPCRGGRWRKGVGKV